jgi:hypothetical protein
MIATATIKTTIRATRTLAGDLEAGSSAISATIQAALVNGTAANQIDLVFGDTVTALAASTPVTYNLDALTDPITGGVVAFAKIRAIIIYNRLTANKALTVGAGSNTFVGPFGNANDTITIPPEGVLMLTAPIAGWTVTADTGDILTITNASGGTSTFDVYILGASA